MLAEFELAGRAAPLRGVVAARKAAGKVAPMLVPAGDERMAPDRRYEGQPARLWCPTTVALRQVREAGLVAAPAPDETTLRRVNHRACFESLLEGARFVHAPPHPSALADGSWIAKRPMSFVGRGQRRLRVGAGGLSDADLAWLDASVRDHGGYQLEPFVDIDLEVGTPGFVHAEGRVEVGGPVVQRVEGGKWVESRAATRNDALPVDELKREVEVVGRALLDHGYWGPFGVDAFRYGGAKAWNLRSEVNARYTMGWALGWKGGRPDL